MLLPILVYAADPVAAQGIDRIRRHSGTESGKISQITALSVTISKGGVENKVPVEDIRWIDFAAEPENLKPARQSARAGRYQDALTGLEAIDRGDVEREAIRQDIDYWQMVCHVQLALSGQGDPQAAIQKVSNFIGNNRTSYHLSTAIELSGNVLLATDQFDAARSQFAKLGKAKSPYFVARSAVLTGISWQQQGNHQAAVEEFDRALAAAGSSPRGLSQHLEATLHRAVSRAASGNVAEATDSVKDVIENAVSMRDKSEDRKLLSRAYNALGDCYVQSGNQQAACDAFLHVDVLFHTEKKEHAKALYELSRLWTSRGKAARAAGARQRLQKNYPDSKWARQ